MSTNHLHSTPQHLVKSQGSHSLSQKDLQTLSALKLSPNIEHNPQKLQEFLQNRKTNYLQSSYGTFFTNPQQSPLFKPIESFQNMKNHHQFSIRQNQRLQYMSSPQKQLLKAQLRPSTQASGIVAQGGGLRSVRALSRNQSMRDFANVKQEQIQNSPVIEKLIAENQKIQQAQDRLQTASVMKAEQPQQRHQNTNQHQGGGTGFQQLEESEGFQKYVKTTIDQYFGKNTGLCTCCAESIRGMQDKVLNFKYPRCEQFIMDKEKRLVKVDFKPHPTNLTTFKADFQPYKILKSPQADNQQQYEQNPLFINATTNSTTYANWGTKPFERVREIRKMPFDSKFNGRSTYYEDFNKPVGKQLPPQFEREYDEKFYQDMKKRNQKGEFAGLLSSPFLAKSTSHEAFNNKYSFPKAKPHPPIEELVSTLNVPLVTQTEFKAQFVEKNKYECPRNHL